MKLRTCIYIWKRGNSRRVVHVKVEKYLGVLWTNKTKKIIWRYLDITSLRNKPILSTFSRGCQVSPSSAFSFLLTTCVRSLLHAVVTCNTLSPTVHWRDESNYASKVVSPIIVVVLIKTLYKVLTEMSRGIP